MLAAPQPSSLALVDPELRPFLQRYSLPELTIDNVMAVRALHRQMRGAQPSPLPATVHHEQRFIAGTHGAANVRLCVFRPKRGAQSPRPVYMFIHGGGFVMGAAEHSDADNAHLAQQLDCVVVAPSYRLAPETRYPGAIEDCYAALRWLHGHAEELNIDRTRIVVGGGSAGGGLAAALALLVRDRGDLPLAGQVLVAPMLDDRTGSRQPMLPWVGEFIWTAQCNRVGWTSLLGRAPGGDEVSEYAAPARAADVSNLPRSYIFTGALDLFMAEDIEYARRLMTAGVATELHVYSGAYHGFNLVPGTALAQRFQRDFEHALRACLASGVPAG